MVLLSAKLPWLCLPADGSCDVCEAHAQARVEEVDVTAHVLAVLRALQVSRLCPLTYAFAVDRACAAAALAC